MLDKFLKQRFRQRIFQLLEHKSDKTFIIPATAHQHFIMKTLAKRAHFHAYIYWHARDILLDKDLFQILNHKKECDIKVILDVSNGQNSFASNQLVKLKGKIRFCQETHGRHFCIVDYKQFVLKNEQGVFSNFNCPRLGTVIKEAFERVWERSQEPFDSQIICSHKLSAKNKLNNNQNQKSG